MLHAYTRARNLRELNRLYTKDQYSIDREKKHFEYIGFRTDADGTKKRCYIKTDKNGTTYGQAITIRFNADTPNSPTEYEIYPHY